MNGLPLRRIDWVALGTILILIGLSSAFIYSAQFKGDDVQVGIRYLKQLGFAGVGLFAYGLVAWYDYKNLPQIIYAIYGGAIFLLLLVFAFDEVNGAHRWIELPGFTLQPSELAKIAVVLMLASYLGEPGRDMDDWRTFFVCAGLAGLPFLLIAVEPDLGTSLVLVPITLAIMLYMGVQRKLLLIGTGGVLLFAVVVCFWIAFETTEAIEKLPPAERPKLVLPKMPLMEGYQKQRVKVFLTKGNEFDDDVGWNKLQAQIAVGSGGLHGKGYLQGTQNILGFLPRTVSFSDFIFCVIAEEVGFTGCLMIIGLYTILIGMCMRTAVRAHEDFGRLIALGISVMLFCHVFVNIAMTIGVLPITGLPLPLMSYGGSFMISTLIALGLVQSVYLRRRRR